MKRTLCSRIYVEDSDSILELLRMEQICYNFISPIIYDYYIDNNNIPSVKVETPVIKNLLKSADANLGM